MNENCSFGAIKAKVPEYRISLSVSFAAFSLTAIMLNTLIIYSIWKTPALHKPSYILLVNLSLTDLLTTSIGGPLFVITNMAALENWIEIFCSIWEMTRIVAYWLASVALFTLTAISVDRLLAIKLKNKYQNLVTAKRVVKILTVYWLGSSALILPLHSIINVFGLQTLFGILAVAISSLLLIITVSYTMAYHDLKKMSSSISPDGSSKSDTTSINSSFDTSKYRRSLNTMLIVLFVMMFFYTPYVLAAITTMMLFKDGGEFTSKVSLWLFVTAGELIVFINSTINPLLYLWRLNDVRQAFKVTVKISIFSKENNDTEERND